MFIANAEAAECSFDKPRKGRYIQGKVHLYAGPVKIWLRHEFNMSSVHSQFYALMSLQQCLYSANKAEEAVGELSCQFGLIY